MANCLITKLKESVNNPNLPFFGSIKIHLLPDVTPTTGITVDTDTHLISPTGNNMTVTANTDFSNLFVQSSDDTIYQLLNGYSIKKLSLSTYNNAFYINTEDLKAFDFDTLHFRADNYSSNKLGLIGKLCDIGSLVEDNNHNKSFDFTNCSGVTATNQELSDFLSRNKNITNFRNENSNVVLDWDILGTVTNGKLIETLGASKGDIYTFVQCARTHERTEGKCNKNYLDTSDKFNNINLPKATFSVITWTSNTVNIKASNTYGGSDILDETWNI